MIFCKTLSTGFPRIRGDVPNMGWSLMALLSFSPHTRGCSAAKALENMGVQVFPAYAGMFRAGNAKTDPWVCFPRIRGDVPIVGTGQVTVPSFSPHTRGCSPACRTVGRYHPVFPAYAGMFRRTGSPAVVPHGFPRIRGDVPHPTTWLNGGEWFSPHTRGCSGQNATADFPLGVFPAYAGMFLRSLSRGMTQRCFPRIRGDVPASAMAELRQIEFSPHTRGCSGNRPGNSQPS